MNKRCVSCGSIKMLELDHIDPKQKVSHNVWSWSQSRREEELLKCQVLCHDCHWEKTKKDNGWGGHNTGRYIRGCRCKECKSAHAASTKRWRDKKYNK